MILLVEYLVTTVDNSIGHLASFPEFLTTQYSRWEGLLRMSPNIKVCDLFTALINIYHVQIYFGQLASFSEFLTTLYTILARRYCLQLPRNTTLQMALNCKKSTAQHCFAGVIICKIWDLIEMDFSWAKEKVVDEISWAFTFVKKTLKACFDGKTKRQHWFRFCSIDGMWPWKSKKYQTVKTYQTSQKSQEMEYHFTLEIKVIIVLHIFVLKCHKVYRRSSEMWPWQSKKCWYLSNRHNSLNLLSWKWHMQKITLCSLILEICKI